MTPTHDTENRPGSESARGAAMPPLIVGHRGASCHAPENTLPAFRLAWEHGADAIEGDFRLTADGAIVCLHDDHTGRVATEKLMVAASTLAQLRQLDVGAHRGAAYCGTVIPTIEEVFAVVPTGKGIYIEIKSGPEILPPLLERIRCSGLRKKQITVMSFAQEVVRAAKARAPRLQVSWLCCVRKDDSGVLRPSLDAALAILERIGADVFSSNQDEIDEPFVKGILEHGYDFHVWTVDDSDIAARFARWGARAITTNKPGMLQEHFSAAMRKERDGALL